MLPERSEIMYGIFRETQKDLVFQALTPYIERFGGHPLRVPIGDCEEDFWSEFIRVKKDDFRTLVFRAVTLVNNANLDTSVSGIRNLIDHNIDAPRIIILDQRSNMERELDPGAGVKGHQHSDTLLDAYQKLLSQEADIILTPVREGSLGPTREVGSIGPFTENHRKNNPHVWDIVEEISQARSIHLALTSGNEAVLNIARVHLGHNYREYALPIAKLLSGELEFLDLVEMPENLEDSSIEVAFFNDVEEEFVIDLGFGKRTVEQVIAYPYPTRKGVIYARLFRVWDVNKKEFEVVRVLQTQPSLANIDGLRIDSSCVDGVHSLDCHCDCKEQLELALYTYGIEQGKNVVVFQMADQEGKGWGTVLKGAAQHRPVREYNALYPTAPISHVDSESHFYNALGVPPDNRNFGAAQAVAIFLGIDRVQRMLMDNEEKIRAMDAIGVMYDSVEPLYPDEDTLSGEAKRAKASKKEGSVKGTSGIVAYLGPRPRSTRK